VTGVRDAGSSVPLATLGRWKQEIAAGSRVGPRLVVSGTMFNGPAPRSNNAHATGQCTTSKHIICIETAAEARLMVNVLKTAGADMLKLYSLSPELYYALAAEARRVGLPFGGHSYVPGLALSDSGASILDHYAWLVPNVCGEILNGVGKTEEFDEAACVAAAQRLRRNGTWVMVSHPAGLEVNSAVFGQYTLDRRRLISPRVLLEAMGKDVGDRALARPAPTSTAAWAAAVALHDSAQRATRDSTQRQAASPTATAAAKSAAQQADNAVKSDSVGRRSTERTLAYLPIIAGSDVTDGGFGWLDFVPGASLHDLLPLYVINGMSPLKALQTATLNPALALRATDSLGTVEVGKLADLVLLDADPLADVWHTTRIRAVVANGRYFDRAALDRLLVQAQTKITQLD
jgi:hypothetical protein